MEFLYFLSSSNKISENLALGAGLTLLAFMFFIIFLETSKESISLMLRIFKNLILFLLTICIMGK